MKKGNKLKFDKSSFIILGLNIVIILVILFFDLPYYFFLFAYIFIPLASMIGPGNYKWWLITLFPVCCHLLFISISTFFKDQQIFSQISLWIFMITWAVIMTNYLIFWERYPFPRKLYIRTFLYLAGKNITNFQDGFTERPFYLKKTNYKVTEFRKFAEFLRKNAISLTYIKPDKIILVFSSGLYQYIPGMEPNWQKTTYFSIDSDGEVYVSISKKDYDEFKEELAFDQLCASFGNLVLNLFERYKKGERNNIIEYLRDNYRPVSVLNKDIKNKIFYYINFVNARSIVVLSLTFILVIYFIFFTIINLTFMITSMLFFVLLKVFIKTKSIRVFPMVYLINALIMILYYILLFMLVGYFHSSLLMFFLISIPIACVLHLYIYIRYKVNIFKRYKMYFFPNQEADSGKGNIICTVASLMRINNYNRHEFIYFAKFLSKNLIATVYYRDRDIYVILSNGLFQYIPLLAPNLDKTTYIVLDEDGDLSVHVSEKDYFNYSNGLIMEKLAAYIGEVFINLYASYKLGDPVELLEQLIENNQNKEGALIY